MRWWKVANSSSSSSSSPKSVIESPVSPFSKQRRALRDVKFFRSRREAASQPRLTRQRKLRHLTDLEIEGLAVNDRDLSKPSVSENSTPLLRSPSNRKSSSERPSSVVPLPLPLPDLSALSRREPGFSGSNSGRFILPSPTEVVSWSREEGDGTEILNGDPVRERTPSPIGRRFPYQISHKSPENVGQSSARSAVGLGAKVLQDTSTVESILCFRHSVPAKSAPSSPLSSPVRSPRRLSSGDCFPSYMGSPGLQFQSVPELPSPDVMSSGFSSNTSPEKFNGPSSEWSPLHSPTRRNVGPKSGNPSGSSTPLQPRISIESSSAWHDNGLLTVHPLPLPPGASVPSQPAFVHHGPVKSELSSMTSQWQKGKLIGSGTFGNVYVATNRETGALCAMKEVNLIPDDPKSAECMQQLEQEIKVLSQLKHPNIVQYYGSEIVEDRFYIYLEYVHPGSISKYVREHIGAMTESVVRNFTRHILSGLAYLHNTKTIHRDIKGANLLVDASGVVKLADFGMAKHLSGQAAALSLKGSPYWMAPEVIQAMMHKEVGYDLAVDIWSLGCTIIEMFNGKAPWSEFEGAAAMFKVLRNECPPIPETLSPDGKDFLQCCFKRNPAERPSASKLLEHRFLKNFSQTHEISGCIQAVSRMKFMDMMQSPRDRSSLVQTSEGNHLPECEIGQSQPETSECAAGLHNSPRSTLEAIPSPSPPHSNYLSRSSAPSNIRGSFGSLGKQQSY